MRPLAYIVLFAAIILASCEDDQELFDSPADARAAEAIAQLRQELTAPENGWLIEYRPERSSGMYYVLLRFRDDGQVIIQSDLGAEDGRYFRDTVTWRVDNSLGLELIFETYSMFSYLFEQEQATFGAEYEFNYVNKTPDNALVFQSKSDLSRPRDIIVFVPAPPTAETLLGTPIAQQLERMGGDLNKVFPSFRLSYTDKDLALYLTMNQLHRTVTFNAASLKSNTATRQSVNFSTTYYLKGDSLVLETPFNRTLFGNAATIRSIRLLDEGQSTLGACAEPLTSHNYTGTTSSNESITLESTLLDVSGNTFAQESDFYFSPLEYVFEGGFSAVNRITNDITGALEMHLYYNFELGGGDKLFGIGFVIRNPDNTITFALREFTPVLNDNQIIFNFEPDISIFNAPTSATNVANIYTYLDALTEGDQTYVFRINTGIFEFHNPCTGWSFVFIDAN